MNQWLLNNKDFLNIYLSIIQTLAAVVIPVILAIWAIYSEKQKAKEQRYREEQKAIKDYINSEMIPFAKKYKIQSSPARNSSDNMKNFARLWRDLAGQVSYAEYKERTDKIYEAIYKNFNDIGLYNYDQVSRSEMRDPDCIFRETYSATMNAYSIIKNEGTFNWHYDKLTLNNEQLEKKYGIIAYAEDPLDA
ncbi:MAG: hypothetical protein ACRCY4_06350 [Brevinema sp.]